MCFTLLASRSADPTTSAPQRAESVPAARRAEAFKLEIRLPFVRVLQQPAGRPLFVIFRYQQKYCLAHQRLFVLVWNVECVKKPSKRFITIFEETMKNFYISSLVPPTTDSAVQRRRAAPSAASAG